MWMNMCYSSLYSCSILIPISIPKPRQLTDSLLGIGQA
jgi:hypothetical protein